ncbi:conserved hypothetical protein [Streptomyces scabiei 87.22]|uniref:Winged helix DNA-binding domain-containing protein n=1 Tax=Streptomyces scabiei (strain 87.22) TaxID=680198 RepID=C9ZF79_STRSW|nr:conserved hypothetical protein [Streptomyces scabiei 87.22]
MTAMTATSARGVHAMTATGKGRTTRSGRTPQAGPAVPVTWEQASARRTERLFPGAAYERALARGQAGNHPLLLVDGVVAGVWHQRRQGRRTTVTVEPLGRLDAEQERELGEWVERVGEVLQARPELAIGKVTVGPHA